MTRPIADPDRPRYRALVTPGVPDAPPGFTLEVTRVDAAWRREAGDRAHLPLVTTWVAATADGALDVAHARLTVLAYLVGRSAPRPCRATPADVALYLRLPDDVPDDVLASDDDDPPSHRATAPTTAPTTDADRLARLDGLRAELDVLRADVADPLGRDLLRTARRDLDEAVLQLEYLDRTEEDP